MSFSSEDLTPQLTPSLSRAVTFGQGLVLEWDPSTFQNVIEWRGISLRNLPVSGGFDGMTIQPGDTVVVKGWAPQGGIGSWWIDGRYIIPGSAAASSRDIRGGDINILEGSSIRLIGGGSLEMLVGNLAGEQPGFLRSFVSDAGRAALRLVPPRTLGEPEDNQLIIEGRTTTTPGGNIFINTGGQFQMFATGLTVIGGDGTKEIISDAGNIAIDANANLHLDGRDQAFFRGENHTRVLGGGQITVEADGELHLNADNDTVRIQHRMGTDSANAFWTGAAVNVLHETTSARSAKVDIEDYIVDPETVLQLRPRCWRDRVQVEEDPETDRWIIGFVADELDEIGLTGFVDYDVDGEPKSIAYDRLSVALIQLAKSQERRLSELELRVAALDGQSAERPNIRPTAKPKRRDRK
jgi:hypothetical protein